MKLIVLDASAIINGFESHSTTARQITTPAVLDEVHAKPKEFKLALDLNKVEAREPKVEFVSDVKTAIRDAQDNLSDADRDLVALALEYKAELVTDDYGIQNIATILGVDFIPVVEKGIEKVLHWEYYCVGCRKVFSKELFECANCGSKIKRRAKI